MEENDMSGDQSFVIGRREFSLATIAALLLSPRLAFSQTPASSEDPAQNFFNDNPAVPVPADPSFGKSKDDAFPPGRGGEYFAAWMLGFAHGLNAKGQREPYASAPAASGDYPG